MIKPRRWLPHPLLSLVLAGVWLLLVNSVAPGQLVFGLLLGLLVPLFSSAFWPTQPRVPRPMRLLRYFLRVVGDIVVANLHVARLILGDPAKLRPAFVRMPLTLRDEFAITVLTSTVSLTPGTVSAEISEDRKSLLIHALDVDDTEALIAQIQQRYEAPLREIFPC
ncbi:MAG: Na+/H+ antiporter subunit E [Gammaproteobacteria bacterium]